MRVCSREGLRKGFRRQEGRRWDCGVQERRREGPESWNGSQLGYAGCRSWKLGPIYVRSATNNGRTPATAARMGTRSDTSGEEAHGQQDCVATGRRVKWKNTLEWTRD